MKGLKTERTRVAAAVLAGALLAPLAASPVIGARPVPAPTATGAHPIALTTAGYQPALDELLAAMAQAAAKDAALPYAPPGSEADVLPIIANTNYQLLMAGISRVTELFNGWFFQSPETVAGDTADPRQYFDFFTPDIYYHVTAGLAPGATYELTGTLGGATEHLSISTEAITAGTAQTVGSLELGHGLVVNPDGSFTVVVGPDNPGNAPNFMDDTDATKGGAASLLIRDMLGDWAKGPGSVAIHCVSDCPAFFAIPDGGFFPTGGPAGGTDPVGSVLSGASAGKVDSLDSALTMLFSAFAGIIGPFNDRAIAGGASVGMELPDGSLRPENTMSALGPETSFGAGLESAVVSGGNFALDPGQALIVKVPDVDSAYSGVELMNVFGAALPYTLAQTTLNNTQAFHAADGYTYYVVSATNPGVANWLDSAGVSTGEIFARFENVDDPDAAHGLAVTTQVVPVGDVAAYLPDDTPTVSASEYAADMAARVLSYDYALDVSRMNAQPSWLIQQLLLHGLQGVLGADNFAAAFGAEPETPLFLRFTPAFSPDLAAVAHDIVGNPTDSLSAIVHTLPVAFSDVALPIEFAAANLALSVLMPQQLLSALTDPIFDPNTSITAGLLNARDDLATAVLTAGGGFPTELGPLATAEWAHLDELTTGTLASQLTEFGSLLGSVFGG